MSWYTSTISFTIYSALASQKNGLFMARCSTSRSVSVIVALNRRVCRFRGKTEKIVWSCSPKLSSSKRSASSRTWNSYTYIPQSKYNCISRNFYIKQRLEVGFLLCFESLKFCSVQWYFYNYNEKMHNETHFIKQSLQTSKSVKLILTVFHQELFWKGHILNECLDIFHVPMRNS